MIQEEDPYQGQHHAEKYGPPRLMHSQVSAQANQQQHMLQAESLQNSSIPNTTEQK